ncbi:MAG: CocE/NonD family hydrolase [Micromonosporaceae bacterium]
MGIAGLLSAAAGHWLRLPPPLTRAVEVRRGLAVRMRDGVVLRTDHYAPRVPGAPTVLIRSPYGRGGVNAVLGRVIAERGHHVVLQSCRGTFGSGGRFDPMHSEREDGLDTVEWLRCQPWFTGRLGTFGPSYVGHVQWAISDVPELAAMATIVTASQFREPTYAGESFSLHSTLTWAALIQAQSGAWLPNTMELLRGQPKLRRAQAHLPLGEADRVDTGVEVQFYREWLHQAVVEAGPGEDGYWDTRGHHHRVSAVTAPVLMVGGWHDIFLPWQLRDYAALRAAGARPRLVIGPWTHGSVGLFRAALRESLAFLGTHLRGEPDHSRRPVRLYVDGGGGWRDLDDWPPPRLGRVAWFLQPEGALAARPPVPSDVDCFRYDPSDPTPSVGGPLLVANQAGPRDNRELEARPDVLTYTGERLAGPLDVVGPVTATVHVRGSVPYFDVFVRLCDVAPSGRSVNVCDGLVRLRPGRFPVDADGFVAVEVELWPTAHRFAPEHRLRVQISGGAHPRYARNPGTGEPLATAVHLRAVAIEVAHDPARASAVHLPVVGVTDRGRSPAPAPA